MSDPQHLLERSGSYRRPRYFRSTQEQDMSDDDTDDWKVTMPKAFAAIREDAKQKDRQRGTVVCPKCGGELGYSISSYNGHIHGQCNTTRGCLSWMM